MANYSDRDVTGRHRAKRRSASRRPSLGARLRELDLRVLRILRTRGHSPAVEAGMIALARAVENGLISGRSYPYARSSTLFAGARALSAAPLYGLAIGLALSLPYLGVHYLSDILAGAILGDAMGRLLTP